MSKEKNGSAVHPVPPYEEEEPERGQWGNPMEFILSCLGYAVGLGNVWRFPYMTFTNGGGAFLIPYVVMLTFVGIPVFMIELAIGQYSACGPGTVWSISPLFTGVGYGMVIISFISSIYYNLIIGWACYYLFAGFAKTLPWQGCHHDYNTEYCYTKVEARDCEDVQNGTWFKQQCFNSTYLAQFNEPGYNCTCGDTTFNYPVSGAPPVDTSKACMTKESNQFIFECDTSTYNHMEEWLANQTARLVSPSEEFFNFRMLDRSDRIEDTGYLKWDLALVLLLAWIICFLCLLKGIKSSGKVVYFTATFPYLLLVILFFRAVLLEGAGKGVKFYLIPDWSLLAKPKVWADAAGQIFFSLSVGTGGLMTFASYNKFNNNIYRDTMIVAIGNCLTSFFAGFVIFSILGFMATDLGVEVKDVAASGSGLAFIAYPEIVTRLPLPQLWSFLFFFMLLTLGLDSQFASIENIQTAITDNFPHLRKKKWMVAGSLCSVMYILGLTQVSRAGIYWEELMSYYSSGWSLVLMGLIEGIVFPWVYGADRLIDDIESMVGFRLYKHWWVCWKFITPVLLVVVFIVNLIEFTPLSYGDYVLPGWSQGLGWCMALVSVAVIPVTAVFIIWRSYKNPDYDGLSFIERVKELTRPTEDWKPANEKGKPLTTVTTPPSYNDATKRQSYENPAFTGSVANLQDDDSRL